MDNRTPYKTAAELGIEQWEHDGLAALVGPLSRDKLSFNMGAAQCGSTRCIGGHLAAGHAISPQDYVGHSRRAVASGRYTAGTHSSSLYTLYFPDGDAFYGTGGWGATGPQASRAIVNFLMTGDPQWDRVMETAEITHDFRGLVCAVPSRLSDDDLPSFDDCNDSGAREHVVEADADAHADEVG